MVIQRKMIQFLNIEIIILAEYKIKHMKKIFATFLVTILFFQTDLRAQIQHPQNNDYQPMKSDFWNNVRFGGGLGVGFGNGFTDVSVSPSAIYQFNEKFATGAGVQFNYLKSKGYYESMSYGVNALALYNPIPEIQLSAEVEQLRVNNEYNVYYSDGKLADKISDDFWNTGLFIGAGYTTNNVTVGVKYNVLYKENNLVYSQAWMPFIRFYF